MCVRPTCFAEKRFHPELTKPADAWLDRADPSATLSEESRLLPNYNAVITLLWARNHTIADGDEELLKSLDPSEFSVPRRRWSGD